MIWKECGRWLQKESSGLRIEMNDWVGLAIIGFLVLCGVIGLYILSKPYELSQEEFEKRVNEGPGLLGASLIGLQKALDPAMEKAVEVQEDLRQGRFDGEQESGEPPEAGQSTETETDLKSQNETGEDDA
jgi:hypothetical protein